MKKVILLLGAGFLLFSLIATAQAFAAEQCLSASQLRQVVANLPRSVTGYEAREDGENVNLGSGFLVSSNLGVEMVSALHVVAKGAPGAPAEDPCAPDNPIPNPPTLLPGENLTFHPSTGVRSIENFRFSTAPHNISFENDTVKIALPNRTRRLPGLEVESSSRGTPAPEEEIIIAGFPEAKSRTYQSHKCVYKGLTESVTSADASHYQLNCPDLNYDLEGMSGGVAISACTGRVIGVVSAQEFSAACARNPGNAQTVQIAPISRNPADQIVFGIPNLRPGVPVSRGQSEFMTGDGVR